MIKSATSTGPAKSTSVETRPRLPAPADAPSSPVMGIARETTGSDAAITFAIGAAENVTMALTF